MSGQERRPAQPGARPTIKVTEHGFILDGEVEYFTVPGLAERTGYSANYLRILLRDGELEGAKIAGLWFASEHAINDYIGGKETRRGGPRGPHPRNID